MESAGCAVESANAPYVLWYSWSNHPEWRHMRVHKKRGNEGLSGQNNHTLLRQNEAAFD
jgi:hypothetical protein